MQLDEVFFWVFAIIACVGAISVVLSQNIVRMAVSLIASLSSVSVLFFLMGAEFVGVAQLMVYVGGTVVLLIFGVMLTGGSPATKLKTSPADVFVAAGIGALLLVIIGTTLGSVDWTHQASSSPKITTPEAHSTATSLTLDPIQDYKVHRYLAIPLTGIGMVGEEPAEANATAAEHNHEPKKSGIQDALIKVEATSENHTGCKFRIDHPNHGATATLFVTNSNALASSSEVAVTVREAGKDKLFDTSDDLRVSRKFRLTAVPNDTRRVAMALLGATKDHPSYLFPFEIISMHLLVVLIGAAYLARPKKQNVIDV
jgi:NADH:ubiquinone oxidoreductase subunit 6 (subunit J)